MSDTAGSTLADWERAEIDRANTSDLTPVLFVHGLWLLSSSWQPWRDFFEDNGFTTVALGCPTIRRPSPRRASTRRPSRRRWSSRSPIITSRLPGS